MQESIPPGNISSEKLANEEIISLLKNLEQRIYRIEVSLNIETQHVPKHEISVKDDDVEFQDKEEELEYRIGQFWLAKAGIIAFIIGIAFFLTFPYKNLPPVFPALIGYIISAGIFGFSNYCRKNFSYIAGYLLGGSLAPYINITLLSAWHLTQAAVISLPFGTPLNPALLLIALSISSVWLSPPWQPAHEIPFLK